MGANAVSVLRIVTGSGRPDWIQTFYEIIEVYKKRITCLKVKAVSLLVKENRLISVGYNGVPRGIPHCFEVGCYKEKTGRCMGCHGEINAIFNALRDGADINGAMLITSVRPCLECAKHLVNHYPAIQKIIYFDEYMKGGKPAESEVFNLFKTTGIQLVKVEFVNDKNIAGGK